MLQPLFRSMIALLVLMQCGCGISPAVVNHYTFTTYHTKVYHYHPKLPSIYVSMPEASPGFNSEQMIYTKVPFVAKPFSHNAWLTPPAEMLYPLLVQSLDATHAFQVVSSGSHTESFQYRVSTDILKLMQSFLTQPSRLEMTIGVIVTDSANGLPIASKIFHYNLACTPNNPYGGAVTANRAVTQFTEAFSQFVVTVIAQHQREKTMPNHEGLHKD